MKKLRCHVLQDLFSTEANKLKIANVIQPYAVQEICRPFLEVYTAGGFMIRPSSGSLNLSFVVLAPLCIHFQQWRFFAYGLFRTLSSSLPRTVIDVQG